MEFVWVEVELGGVELGGVEVEVEVELGWVSYRLAGYQGLFSKGAPECLAGKPVCLQGC